MRATKETKKRDLHITKETHKKENKKKDLLVERRKRRERWPRGGQWVWYIKKETYQNDLSKKTNHRNEYRRPTHDERHRKIDLLVERRSRRWRRGGQWVSCAHCRRSWCIPLPELSVVACCRRVLQEGVAGGCCRRGLYEWASCACCWSAAWISHVTYARVMSHMNESCHIWMSHVTHEWVMSHIRMSVLRMLLMQPPTGGGLGSRPKKMYGEYLGMGSSTI